MRRATTLNAIFFAAFVLVLATVALVRASSFRPDGNEDVLRGKLAHSFESHYDKVFPARTFGVALLAWWELWLLDGAVADWATADRGGPAAGDLPCGGVCARRRDACAHQRQRGACQDRHQRPGQHSCGSWPLRSLARADVGASCSRGWRGQKGRRSASAASSPGLGHAASFAGPARGRLHEQADGYVRGTLTITPDRVNRPIPTS